MIFWKNYRETFHFIFISCQMDLKNHDRSILGKKFVLFFSKNMSTSACFIFREEDRIFLTFRLLKLDCFNRKQSILVMNY